MPAPAYDVLLLAHVACALLGFGSIAVGGGVAAAARRSASPASEERIARFFRQGTDWPSRLIYAVPILGLAMLLGGDRGAVSLPWPWLGLAVWTMAAGTMGYLGWPAERQAQAELAAVASGDATRLPAFADACARMERAAGIASVCFVVVVTLMIWQP